MKLWKAILIGCDRREQAFGDFFVYGDNGQCKSCALGAAYEAMTNETPRRPKLPGPVSRFFPHLITKINHLCPDCDCRSTLSYIIIHLNDDHHWSREKIALEFVKPIEEAMEEENETI